MEINHPFILIPHPTLEKPCKKWTGFRTEDGHGRMKFRGKLQLVHRVAWYLHYGSWPEPQCNHHCDLGTCFEITHLYAGTQKQNMIDRSNRGIYPISDKYRCGHLKGVDDIRNGTYRGKPSYICGPCTRQRKANAKRIQCR